MNEHHNKNISPIAVGIAGVILGVAGTLAVAFTDDYNKKRATKKAKDLKDNLTKLSNEWTEEFHHKSYDVRKNLSKKLDPDTAIVDETLEEGMEEKPLHN